MAGLIPNWEVGFRVMLKIGFRVILAG